MAAKAVGIEFDELVYRILAISLANQTGELNQEGANVNTR
jgi:hypothetical protein